MVLSYKITVAEALQGASAFLQAHGIENAPVKDYWQRVFDWSFTQLILNMNKVVNDQDIDCFNQVLAKLKEHQPIQYILGHTFFADQKYLVNPATLIPREDTYGLITLALKEIKKKNHCRILDIGTGSGIIAIELAKQVTEGQVTASDISAEALQVAKTNADLHGVDIEFIQSDLFAEFDENNQFDIIVSNPPYIAEEEISLMDQSVLIYEPKIALFASHQGLAIYQAIAQEVAKYLQPQGCMIFEIGFKQGQAVKKIFADAFPQAKIEVHQDLNGLDRYVKVNLEEE